MEMKRKCSNSSSQLEDLRVFPRWGPCAIGDVSRAVTGLLGYPTFIKSRNGMCAADEQRAVQGLQRKRSEIWSPQSGNEIAQALLI
jgi:hypothetical protein